MIETVASKAWRVLHERKTITAKQLEQQIACAAPTAWSCLSELRKRGLTTATPIPVNGGKPVLTYTIIDNAPIELPPAPARPRLPRRPPEHQTVRTERRQQKTLLRAVNLIANTCEHFTELAIPKQLDQKTIDDVLNRLRESRRALFTLMEKVKELSHDKHS